MTSDHQSSVNEGSAVTSAKRKLKRGCVFVVVVVVASSSAAAAAEIVAVVVVVAGGGGGGGGGGGRTSVRLHFGSPD